MKKLHQLRRKLLNSKLVKLTLRKGVATLSVWIGLFVTGAHATPTVPAALVEKAPCTLAPKSEWFDTDEFQLLARHRGYKIVVFKVTYGACYEIYGYNKAGDLVEAYFNPVTTRLMRSNVVKIPR